MDSIVYATTSAKSTSDAIESITNAFKTYGKNKNMMFIVSPTCKDFDLTALRHNFPNHEITQSSLMPEYFYVKPVNPNQSKY